MSSVENFTLPVRRLRAWPRVERSIDREADKQTISDDKISPAFDTCINEKTMNALNVDALRKHHRHQDIIKALV